MMSTMMNNRHLHNPTATETLRTPFAMLWKIKRQKISNLHVFIEPHHSKIKPELP